MTNSDLRFKRPAFSLVELLVTMAILSIIMLIVFGIVTQTSDIWKSSKSRIESFQAARTAFEVITRRLSQATLNTYWDYEYDSAGAPVRYGRRSELHAVFGQGTDLLNGHNNKVITHAAFFQSMLGRSSAGSPSEGLGGVLNETGFYVLYEDENALTVDAGGQPLWFVNTAPKFRFRLMEVVRASEGLEVYATWQTLLDPTTGLYSYNAGRANEWFANVLDEAPKPSRVIADNVIALVMLPKMSPGDINPQNSKPYEPFKLAPNYAYDSRDRRTTTTDSQDITANQLPPLVQVLMVAVDEPSAVRLNLGSTTTDPFEINANAGLFKQGSITGQDQLDDDLQTLEGTLSEMGVNYRVFQTEVMIRTSKWSTE